MSKRVGLTISQDEFNRLRVEAERLNMPVSTYAAKSLKAYLDATENRKALIKVIETLL